VLASTGRLSLAATVLKDRANQVRSWLKELRTVSSRQQRLESDVMENIGQTKLFAGLQQTSS
ncbi:hypothetical protein, partial [Xanthomonas oryzae]